MTSYVSADLRHLFAARANRRCEYCRIHEDDTFLGCQVDHIIAEKHGGLTVAGNLSDACTFCNRFKGSDVGSVIPETNEFVRFFNPRTDLWNDHFAFDGVLIMSRTAIGEATARILGINSLERILERQSLLEIGRYPPPNVPEPNT